MKRGAEKQTRRERERNGAKGAGAGREEGQGRERGKTVLQKTNEERRVKFLAAPPYTKALRTRVARRGHTEVTPRSHQGHTKEVKQNRQAMAYRGYKNNEDARSLLCALK